MRLRWPAAAAGLALACGLNLPQPAAGAEPGPAVTAPVVVVGIAGLTWDAVSPARTPTLWKLLDGGADAAAATVRSVHSPPCPLDGWLSLSAGRAATDPQRHRDRGCTALPRVTGRAVDGWDGLVAAQRASVFDPDLGLLGSTLAAGRVCATAIGPGAALALADERGQVVRYQPEVTGTGWDCPVTVVDAGVIDRYDGDPPVRSADEVVGRVLRHAPANATVIVMGVSQPLHSQLAMGAVVVSGPGAGGRFLTARSTRWQGIVRLLDIPSTVVAAVGLAEPNHFTGSPLIGSGARPGTEATASKLTSVTHRDRELRRSSGPLVNGLAAASVLAFAALAVWRRNRRGTALLEVLLTTAAALPLCAYLVRLIQWWRWPAPSAALWLGMVLSGLAVGLALRRLPRVPVWLTVTVLAGLTTATLAVDAVTGTILHHGSPLGPSPLSGGRYYGFGNTTFVVFAVHALLFAAGLATWLRPRRGRVVAALAAAGVGVGAVLVDGWPTWGADVGGGFALVPAFALLTLDVLGLRISALRVLLAGVGALAVVALICVLDWLRPAASRSHAGRFVEDLVNGDGLAVVTRKAGYAIGSLSAGPHLWPAGLVLIYLIAVVLLRRRLSPSWFEQAVTRWPQLWGAFAAIVAVAAIGSSVNDYGLRVMLLAIGVAGPPLMLTWLRSST